MHTLRIQHVRSLADTGSIELRPLTILVGRNSSGKSTFLRSLPLIKQSVRTRSRAPLLWYGDYVDFGSFNEAHTKSLPGEPISFELGFRDLNVRTSSLYEYRAQYWKFDSIESRIELNEVDGETKLRKLQITADEDVLVIELDGRGSVSSVFINENDITATAKRAGLRVQQTEVVPLISFDPSKSEREVVGLRPGQETIESEVVRLLRPHIGNRVADRTLLRLVRRIRFAPFREFESQLQRARSDLVTWNALMRVVPKNLPLLKRLHSLHFLMILPEMATCLQRDLFQTSAAMSYIGPSRATGERYYRFQELGVDQIDPQGKNLAMYLNSLSRQALASFSEWLHAAIGYHIKVERSAGHVQVLLQEASSQDFYNMADMGYGFSQILPILAQVWGSGQRRPLRTRSPIVVMEQPELHLHPAYQGHLADLFASVVQGFSEPKVQADVQDEVSASVDVRRPLRTRLIVETHSETIVNRLGELVSRGELDPQNVAIYMFEKDELTSISKVRRTEFEPDGTLNNWPIGFFAADRF